jgi:hypothetical protein
MAPEILLCNDVVPPRISARGIVMPSINVRGCVHALCTLLMLSPVALTGQSRHLSRHPISAEPSTDEVVTELRHMQVDGISDELMISYIRSRGHAYQLAAEQVIRLKDGGVDDVVIKALMGDNVAGPAPQPSRTQVATVPASLSIRPEATAQPEPRLPNEVGVYAKQSGEWIEVLPEIVNWKTGGVVKNLTTVGIVKGDVNGHILGKTSRTRCSAATKFLIVVPEGTSVTEYQLLRLRENNNNREFRTVTGGVFHVSGGAARDLLSFEGTKVGPRSYVVTFQKALAPGEYGFPPPGAIFSSNLGSAGKINSFTVRD